MKTKITSSVAYVSSALALYPATGSAHVKWFAQSNEKVIVSDENTAIYAITWSLIAIIAVLVAIVLEKKASPTTTTKVGKVAHSFEYRFASLLSLLLGAYFLIAAYQGFLFSANLDNVGSWHSILVGIEAFIGISFLLGVGVRQSSLLLLLLWVFCCFYVGALSTLENLQLLGIALFTLIYGRQHFRYTREDIELAGLLPLGRKYAIPILRLTLGFNLLLLGFSEKILRPDLGLAFLDQHDWNFMQHLGVHWYSDYLFVFSAGAVEAILGVVLMLGIATRLNALVITIVFLLPPFFMGPSELVGHMPHLAMLALLILFGAGSMLRLFPAKEPQTLQVSDKSPVITAGASRANVIALNQRPMATTPADSILNRHIKAPRPIKEERNRRRKHVTPINTSRIPYLAATFAGKNARRLKNTNLAKPVMPQ